MQAEKRFWEWRELVNMLAFKTNYLYTERR